jgi:glucokinase
MRVAGDRVIGIDVGGTKILGAVVAADGSLGARREVRTDRSSAEGLLETIARVAEELLRGERRAPVGIGLPSRVDQRSGRVAASVNIPFNDVDVRGWMSERLGKPVAIDNDANAAAIAEWRVGAGKGVDDMVMLTLGTGVGGGLILNGRPFRGATGVGAELGHVVIDFDGPECPCGGHGHLEIYASGLAADAAARKLIGPDADGRDLVARARQGDAGPREALAEIGRRLGAGILGIVNVFDPDLVVIGGGFAAAGSLLLDPARAVVEREALVPSRTRVRIVRAQLGPDAGVIGAGLIGLEAA